SVLDLVQRRQSGRSDRRLRSRSAHPPDARQASRRSLTRDLSRLPAVHRLLDEPRVARFVALVGAPIVKAHVAAAIAAARNADPTPSQADIAGDVLARLGA